MADLRLVSDNTNVEQFPGVNLGDVRQAMLAVAEKIEAEEFGKVTKAVLVLETENGIEQFHWGDTEEAIQAIGLLQLAMSSIILSQLAGDGE